MFHAVFFQADTVHSEPVVATVFCVARDSVTSVWLLWGVTKQFMEMCLSPFANPRQSTSGHDPKRQLNSHLL